VARTEQNCVDVNASHKEQVRVRREEEAQSVTAAAAAAADTRKRTIERGPRLFISDDVELEGQLSM